MLSQAWLVVAEAGQDQEGRLAGKPQGPHGRQRIGIEQRFEADAPAITGGLPQSGGRSGLRGTDRIPAQIEDSDFTGFRSSDGKL